MKPLINLLFVMLSISMSNCNSHDDIKYPLGGYNFSKNNKAGYFPPTGKISKRDSFDVAHEDPYFFNLFDEKNLSVEPSPIPIFRLAYKDRFDTYIITLSEGAVLIKTGKGRYWPERDFSKLTKQEHEHYRILKMDYPIDEPKSQEFPEPLPPPDQVEQMIRWKKTIDSIKKNTPLLLKTEYYDYLVKKITVSLKDSFTYSITKIKITKEQFTQFISILNQSTYWTMPYYSNCCIDMDGYRYSLEANTGKKYNYVGFTGPCYSDTTQFHKACQELIILAKLDNKVRLAGILY
jgi:hypothetical protein